LFDGLDVANVKWAAVLVQESICRATLYDDHAAERWQGICAAVVVRRLRGGVEVIFSKVAEMRV
jgi:hypothetical protein